MARSSPIQSHSGTVPPGVAFATNELDCDLRDLPGASGSCPIFGDLTERSRRMRVAGFVPKLPNLLNFIKGNGTLVTHEHTPLISHTADDIVTSETGLYGSDQGVPIANEYHYYVPGGSTDEAGSFAYWTDPIVDYFTGAASKPIADSTPTMVNSKGKNTPAPWVPYTRAGCDFGTVAAANTELENTLPDESAHDTVYTNTEAALAKLGAQRDAIAGSMRAMLFGAAFHGVPINPHLASALLHRGAKLLHEAARLAS